MEIKTKPQLPRSQQSCEFTEQSEGEIKFTLSQPCFSLAPIPSFLPLSLLVPRPLCKILCVPGFLHCDQWPATSDINRGRPPIAAQFLQPSFLSLYSGPPRFSPSHFERNLTLLKD